MATTSWTAEDAARAKDEGWRMVDVVDNGSARPYVMIAGLGPLSDRTASTLVLDRAKQGSSFHVAALRFMLMSRLRPRKR